MHGKCLLLLAVHQLRSLSPFSPQARMLYLHAKAGPALDQLTFDAACWESQTTGGDLIMLPLSVDCRELESAVSCSLPGGWTTHLILCSFLFVWFLVFGVGEPQQPPTNNLTGCPACKACTVQHSLHTLMRAECDSQC